MEWGKKGVWLPLVVRPKVDWGNVVGKGFVRFGLQAHRIPFGIGVVQCSVVGLGLISVGF